MRLNAGDVLWCPRLNLMRPAYNFVVYWGANFEERKGFLVEWVDDVTRQYSLLRVGKTSTGKTTVCSEVFTAKRLVISAYASCVFIMP